MGKTVEVVDAKTGEDLTRVTLTQIIVEDAKEQPTGLPLELLRQLIVATDRVGQEFIMWYLKSAFDAYKKVQSSSVRPSQRRYNRWRMSPLQVMKNLIPGARERNSGRTRRGLAGTARAYFRDWKAAPAKGKAAKETRSARGIQRLRSGHSPLRYYSPVI